MAESIELSPYYVVQSQRLMRNGAKLLELLSIAEARHQISRCELNCNFDRTVLQEALVQFQTLIDIVVLKNTYEQLPLERDMVVAQFFAAKMKLVQARRSSGSVLAHLTAAEQAELADLEF